MRTIEVKIFTFDELSDKAKEKARDHSGMRAGERRQIRNGKTGQLAWILSATEGDDLPRYVDSDTKPTGRAVYEYVPWERVGDGKERQLDAARRAAVWPEATDAQLCAEPEELRAMLEARLPSLLREFRADMESCGFEWREPTNEATP